MKDIQIGDVRKAFKALSNIEATTSRIDKENILKDNKNNPALQKLLVATYDPFVIYGIKKDPKPVTKGHGDYETNFVVFLELLEDLSDRTLTGNKAIEAIHSKFEHFDEEECKWYMKVLQKDLKIGITDKTINKVWKPEGGLIPVFTCALANSWEPKKTPKRFVADIKHDGYRCLAFNYEDRVELRSRNGHLLEGYAGIEKDVSDYLPKGFVYDGEILGREGTFNEIQKSAFKKGKDDKDGVLNIFDAVQIEEFETNNFKYSYEVRLQFLDQLNDILEGARSLARVYQTRPLLSDKPEDMEALMTFHAQNVAQGLEGTMIKNLDAKYKMDKSNNILKMKDFYDIDLVVTGIYEGREGTALQGTMGGVHVELSWKDIEEQLPINDPKHKKKLPYIKGGVFKVSVGSGWDLPERSKYWENPNLIIGKTIEIQFQELSINDENQHSLRFPTLVRVRDDK